ncbi:MAG: type II secretion system F family protein [Mitsuaria chitosanitabida]|uniref:type II secretion system F family protein n=1 Tax=Roseateles chitosanitabidus TaxID=65048 RepID=UPI001B2D0DF3|nr:type II secretion system F family protein [Roseateles chitosanitabidus]MBO9686277.1 type II secretion system F family protein [Roseateles chitosanitabidus]
MDLSLILFSGVAFLAVLLAIEGLYILWASRHSAEAKRIAARLSALSGENPAGASSSIERAQTQERLPRLNALLARTGPGRKMRRLTAAAAVTASVAELMLLSLTLGACGLLLPMLLGKPMVVGLGLALGLAVLPWWRVASRATERTARMERQFPEALDLMGRAMRAGHAFPSAIRMVAEEMPAPLGRDFRILFDEINYGVPANDALTRLAERVPIPDVSYFVVAVMIQRESGGNLAELLDKISALVRDRLRLLGEVRTLSAEGRLSAMILTALPFGVAMVVNLLNPDFMAVLWSDPLGLRMVGVALFMMAVGILWMRRIIRIRV